jgi:hypothetical protein
LILPREVDLRIRGLVAIAVGLSVELAVDVAVAVTVGVAVGALSNVDLAKML